MKGNFKLDNVFTMINAEECEKFSFGYFANDLRNLRKSVENRTANFHTAYDRLLSVSSDNFAKRFICSQGAFVLFYPTEEFDMEL